VTLELPVRELVERRAEALAGERKHALALDLRSARGCAARRPSRQARASAPSRASQPDQEADREPADGGQRDVQRDTPVIAKRAARTAQAKKLTSTLPSSQ
jgi:hypothetical protein